MPSSSCWDSCESGVTELRDHQSLTGLATSFRSIAARNNVVIAKLQFPRCEGSFCRKSARALWYLDVQTNDRFELLVDEFDALHEDCQARSV